MKLFTLAIIAIALIGCQHQNLRHDPIEGLEFVLLPGLPGEKDLWIGRTEVTVRAWRGCATHGPCNKEPLEHHALRDGKEACAGSGTEGEQPLNCVSYEEAEVFCKWLRGRVPTSLEWERAAHRSGDEAITATLANWTSTGSGKGDRQIRRGTWRDASDTQRSWLSGARPAQGFGAEVGFRCVQEGEP